jgi:predicted RNase H-like HicB family nuclease
MNGPSHDKSAGSIAA